MWGGELGREEKAKEELCLACSTGLGQLLNRFKHGK